jgi:hypothetical protein
MRRELTEAGLAQCVEGSANRLDLWISFVNAVEARDVAEIGVYRGDFAAALLRECQSISRYFMVDPWRHLEDWNKPANRGDETFERLFGEAMDKTSAHAEKRVVLRGRTSEVIGQIPDGSLDFAYVDGDHTLRGITIDLVKVYPKVRNGAWIGGDDFCRSIWQHGRRYEPTLVFPFAIYFAEAVSARIYGLPHNQFLIEKSEAGGFEFIDFARGYAETELRAQLLPKDTRGRPESRRKGRRRKRGAKASHPPLSLGARVRRRLRL